MFADLSGLQLHNLIIREWLNGGLLPLCLCLVAVIGKYLWDCWREFGAGWSLQPGVRTACALFWIFLADAARAGFVWLLLRAQNRHAAPGAIEQISNIGFVLAAAFGLIATLRCVYLFTPKACGHWGWICCAVLTAAFLAVSHGV